ncbi:MAG: response regulator [Chloroflexi bacterium]|jgi:CheY-like chemotaxis protein|nr:response regulator [Chloroflexota bacterium]
MKDRSHLNPVRLLLVEDSPADARLTRESLKDCKVMVDLHHVRDGVEAMQYLRREGKFADAQRPDLVILDLNMPRKDGRETLEEIKSDPDLRRIPVVILTISDSEEDILKTYNLHANAYITKPIDLEQFSRVVHEIDNFWFTIVKLPNGSGI